MNYKRYKEWPSVKSEKEYAHENHKEWAFIILGIVVVGLFSACFSVVFAI